MKIVIIIKLKFNTIKNTFIILKFNINWTPTIIFSHNNELGTLKINQNLSIATWIKKLMLINSFRFIKYYNLKILTIHDNN